MISNLLLRGHTSILFSNLINSYVMIVWEFYGEKVYIYIRRKYMVANFQQKKIVKIFETGHKDYVYLYWR